MACVVHCTLLVLLGMLLPWTCHAHGRLTKPQGQSARTGPEGTSGYSPCWKCSNGQSKWYANGKSGYCCETHPTEFNSGVDESFVCRHAEPQNNNAPLQVVAGEQMDLAWDMVATAEHEGDCAVFISYDYDKPRKQQKYVKIANLPYCRQQELQSVSIDIPSGLPSGRAILRWDWRAYHLWPSIEWYAQCADIQVQSSSGRAWPTLDSYSIIDPPVYPQNCREGVGCRNPFAGNGYSQRDTGYITGPACFDGTLNRCDMTAPGTQGFTGFGGGDVISTPTFSPSPASAAPSAPSPQPPPSLRCNKEKYAQCGGSDFLGDACCPEDMWCMYDNEWWSQCEPCDETWDTACEDTPMHADATSTTTTSSITTSFKTSATTMSNTAMPACVKNKYSQCGGDGFSGDTCCPAGMWCMETNRWWSQCEPCSETWSVACETIPASGPATSTISTTTTSRTVMPACMKSEYAQCGGIGFLGDTCCPTGMWCMKIEACNEPSKWMARCEPCDKTWDAVGCSSSLAQKRSKRLKFRGTPVPLDNSLVQANATLNFDVQADLVDGAFEEL